MGIRSTGLLRSCALTVAVLGGCSADEREFAAVEKPSPEAALKPLFDPRHERTTENFIFRSNTWVPADAMRAAENTWRTVRATLGARSKPAATLPIYICRDMAEVRRLAAAQGVTAATRSAYYKTVPMIAVIAHPERTALTVSHEVVHAIVGSIAPRCPASINEGIACLYSEKLVVSQSKNRSRWRAWRLRQIVARGQPTLREILDLRGGDFNELTMRGAYELSWCLAVAMARNEMLNATSFAATIEALARDGLADREVVRVLDPSWRAVIAEQVAPGRR